MSVMTRSYPTRMVETDLPAWDDSLLAHHNRYFSTVLADTPGLIQSAHALRFQVYCLERGFENADEHPTGLETDAYDAHSLHGVLIHRPSRRPIGTVRTILPIPGVADSLPIAKLLQTNSLDLADYVIPSQTIEISRFAISKEFRRRKADDVDDLFPPSGDAARGVNLPFVSLLQFALRQSIRHNVLFWTAVMEPKFLRLLARMGICYTPAGPVVEHHGIRQPCYCYLPEMIENARRVHPQCWEVLTDGGALHDEIVGTGILERLTA